MRTAPMLDELPAIVQILIEVPLGGFVKRELHETARVDFVSPVPSPFNYGYVVGSMGEDGDPLDAVVLGPRRPQGTVVEGRIVARIRFIDGGCEDHKLVVAESGLTRSQRWFLVLFFRLYAVARSGMNLARGQRGRTAFLGLEEIDGGESV